MGRTAKAREVSALRRSRIANWFLRSWVQFGLAQLSGVLLALLLVELPASGQVCYQFSDAQDGQPPTFVATLSIASIPPSLTGSGGSYGALFTSSPSLSTLAGVNYSPANVVTITSGGTTYLFNYFSVAISYNVAGSNETMLYIIGSQVFPSTTAGFSISLVGQSNLFPTGLTASLPPLSDWGGFVLFAPNGLGGGGGFFTAIASIGSACALGATADIFIGGLYDGTSHLVFKYYTTFKSDNPTITSEYFSWDGTSPDGGPALESYIASLAQGTTINLIGHSYGGDTAVNVAGTSGRQINLLITIDPVGGRSVPVYPTPSFRQPSRPPLPAWPRDLIPKLKAMRLNTTTWIDVDAQPTTNDESDLVALVGGKWGTLPDTPVKYDDLFIPAVGVHHYQFSDMMVLTGSTGKSAQDILLGQ